MSALKDLFNKIGKETVKLIDDEIVRQNLIKTGALRRSVDYAVIINSRSEYRLTFTQIFYGHFLDKGTRTLYPREFFQRFIDAQLDKYEVEIIDAVAEDLLDELLDDKKT